MAFTKINAAGIGTTETVTVDGLTVINDGSFGGNLTVSGVLTYEDVTNVDSVGLITARNGIVVGSGITLSKDGDVFFTGIATGNGSGLTALNASNLGSGTVPTARLGSGTASSSTFLRGDSTFQTVNTDLVSDTSPQLGGDLDSNTNDIHLNNSGDVALRWQLSGTNKWSIFHNTAGSTNSLNIFDNNGNGTAARFLTNGAVELYHDNTKRFETTSNGATFSGTSGDHTEINILGYEDKDARLNLSADEGDDDADKWRMVASVDSNFYLQNYASGSWEWNLRASGNGAVELYHNNIKKFDTVTTGIRVHGDEGGTAQLQLLADQGDDNADYWRFVAETDGTLNMQDYGSGSWYNNIRLTGNTGGVILYQNNDAKFQTQSDGVRVEDGGKLYLQNDSEDASSAIRNVGGSGASTLVFTTGGTDRWQILNGGHLVPQANNSYDIGESSYRIRNLYTMDLQLSNKGKVNDVDATWGDWTLQEGESDVFMINNRSGKKFKIKMEEVF